MFKTIRPVSLIFFWLYAASSLLYAREIYVSSMQALQAAINSAVAGDTLILANGTYLNNSLNIGKSNITVRSATPGGVFLNGSQGVYISGDYVTFSGFQFTSGDIGSGYLIIVAGNHNVLTQLNFRGYYAKKYIQIDAGTRYNEIEYCNIENKPQEAVTGCTIQINTSPTVPGYHKIRYCSFRNFPGPGGDYGNEPIRVGLGAERDNVSRTIIEFCYFENVGSGDGESISIKCCENIVRYCTFNNNPDGMLVFRNGDRDIAYSNFFLNGSGGIRVKEANDIYCYNNYFETAGAFGSKEAIKIEYVSPFCNNVNFLFNTFVNSGDIDLGGSGPANVRFTNNIFVKSSGNIFMSPNGQTSWAGNIYKGNIGIPISSGMTNIDPDLSLNTDGYYGLTSSSPAIDAADSNYLPIYNIQELNDDPAILFDISGQSRPDGKLLKDVGCDEYTTGVITNKPLKLSDVGPVYLRPTMVESELASSNSGYWIKNYPNPFNTTTKIIYSIPKPSNVLIKVYDHLGAEVETLLNESKTAGTYEIVFTGTFLPSGIYYYSIIGDNYHLTKPMVLIK